jgi:hypothetical protein
MISSPELFFFSVSPHSGVVFLQQVGLFTLFGLGETVFFFPEAEEVKTMALLLNSIAQVVRMRRFLFFMVVVYESFDENIGENVTTNLNFFH